MLGISQEKLGIRAGIDVSSASSRMNQYEKGTHSPDYQTAERIAEQLDVPCCYLYCADEQLASLLLAYHRLSTSEKKHLVETVTRQFKTPGEE